MDMPLAVTILIAGVIKPLLILLLLLVIAVFIRKKSASLQHFVFTMGFIGILLLPLIGFVAPNIAWHVLPSLDSINTTAALWLGNLYDLLVNQLTKLDVMVIVGIYTLVATWILFYFLLGLIGLYRQTLSSSDVKDIELKRLLDDLRDILDIQRSVRVVTGSDIASPQMWGFIHPTIMLPKAAVLWEPDKKLAVMMHELGHVRRHDWLVTLMVKITCAIFWFLPPVWWCAQKMYQQAEIASDDFIYHLRDKHIRYAETLLAFGCGDSHRTEEADLSLGILGRSALYERINAVLDSKRPHQSVPVETAQYWVLLGGFFLVLMASVQLLPIKKVFFDSTNSELSIHLMSPAIDEHNEIAPPLVKKFDWQELQHLRPTLMDRPPALENMESLAVQAPSRNGIDFPKEIFAGEGIPLNKPDIKIQGYLPLDIVVPEYPANALQKGVEGWVKVVFTIGVNGEVIDPKILEQYPSTIFAKAALKAITHSRYRPQLFDGQPVVLEGVVEQFTFTLEKTTPSNRRR